jgi:membrane protein YdbS with pleckstrin-like domain
VLAETKDFRPVIVPVVVINGIVTIFFVVGAASAVWLLSRAILLPAIFFSSIDGILILVGVLFFAQTVLRALWIRLTEAYKVQRGFLLIRRGWASRTAEQIPSTNIADAVTVLPLLLRLFRVGSVVVSTNDGFVHEMRNIRNPQDLTDEIRQQLSSTRGDDGK